MNADQDLNAQFDAAAAAYSSNPKPLRRLTRRLRHPDTRKLCRRSAKLLLRHEPNSIEAIASLIFCYSSGTNAKNLRTAFDLAQQRAQGDPDLLETILAKVRQGLDEQGRSQLNALLASYDAEADQIARRQRVNLQAQERLLQRPQVQAHSCDVITVASNEGPYIAEFIHHYLFQGFSNLFIGLNNDSSGHTGRIVAAISQHYPQVHLINTDPEHRDAQQRGSYCRLYDVASRTSTASHCMVVDVDETWVAYPFSSKISDVLAAHADADVVSSNWLHCHGGELFDNPLDLSNTRLRLTDQFKSLFRYGIAVTDLGAHVPWVLAEPEIRHTSSDGQLVLSKPANGLRRLRKRGIQASINTANTGWVIHRHTRSELEYASKLLYPDVNKQAIPFKANRKGYVLPKESRSSRQLATQLFGPEHQPPQAYRDSLERFIDRCGLRDLIAAARSDIAEAPIRQRIDAMDPAQIHDNRSIWTRTFRGTRFLKLLEQRSGKTTLGQKA